MKIPEHILEKITGSTEHFERGFITGWNACGEGLKIEYDAFIEPLLKREGDLRKENQELKAKLEIARQALKEIKD